MIKITLTALRSLTVMTVLTGVAYPLIVTGIGSALFPREAGGSLLRAGDKVRGSALIAQKFTAPRYFHPRPSAADFATLPSGASNLAPTSATLRAAVDERRAAVGADAPPELLFASASGLDPEVSPKAAEFQISRVLAARGLGATMRQELESLVSAHTKDRALGFIGERRVNVLELNLALDERFP